MKRERRKRGAQTRLIAGARWFCVDRQIKRDDNVDAARRRRRRRRRRRGSKRRGGKRKEERTRKRDPPSFFLSLFLRLSFAMLL